eukprot:3112289-Pyramimonas_sp.AAC.1
MKSMHKKPGKEKGGKGLHNTQPRKDDLMIFAGGRFAPEPHSAMGCPQWAKDCTLGGHLWWVAAVWARKLRVALECGVPSWWAVSAVDGVSGRGLAGWCACLERLCCVGRAPFGSRVEWVARHGGGRA